MKAEEGEILFSAASDHTLCREEDGESLLLHEDEEEDERGEKEQWALTNTELGWYRESYEQLRWLAHLL